MQLRILFQPPVVVMVRRGEDLLTSRMIRQPAEPPRAHDPPGQARVIALGDQEKSIRGLSNDHTLDLSQLPTPNSQLPTRVARTIGWPARDLPGSFDFRPVCSSPWELKLEVGS